VLETLLDHVADALRASGDLEEVRRLAAGLLRRGTGAARQRGVHAATGDPAAVVADLLRRTEASWQGEQAGGARR
jgi:carboxylate-amine ligase